MRLFKKTSTTATPPGAVGAEAEAAEEIRRAAEVMGMPLAPDAADSLAHAMVAEDMLAEAVPAPHEADLPWEEAEAAEPEGLAPDVDDPLPEEAEAAEPVRRRVRRTPPRVAATPPERTRASTRTSGSGRR